MDDPLLNLGAQPKHWNVCFSTTGLAPWLDRLIPGRFKHVRAFGFVPLEGLWIFVDCNLMGLQVKAARDKSQACDILTRAWISDSEVVLVPHRERRRLLPGLYCAGAIGRLIGAPGGALLPSTLHRQCLATGGKLFDEGSAPSASCSGGPARSGA